MNKENNNENQQHSLSSILIESLNNSFKTTCETIHFCYHWVLIPLFTTEEEVKEITKNIIFNLIEFNKYIYGFFCMICNVFSEDDIEELSKKTNLNIKNIIDAYTELLEKISD